MTAQTIFDSMPDPDDVGESEYRIVHEHIANVIASASPAVAPDGPRADAELMEIVAASLDELVSAARIARQQFREAAARTSLAHEILRRDREFTDVLEAGDDSRLMRYAMETHGWLNKAKTAIEVMPEGDDKEQARDLAHKLVKRVMVEAFHLDVEESKA